MLPKYRDVAMVFQSYALYPHKTVAENIGFPLKVRGMPPRRTRPRGARGGRAGAHGRLLDRYPRQLSGGQRQRVALGPRDRARPSVFLMDEPLSNLDAKLRGYMRAELKHMQHELGVTTDLRHPRPGRGDDARAPRRGDGPGRAAADRHAARGLRPPGQPVRRRLHRLAADELLARPDREQPLREPWRELAGDDAMARRSAMRSSASAPRTPISSSRDAGCSTPLSTPPNPPAK